MKPNNGNMEYWKETDLTQASSKHNQTPPSSFLNAGNKQGRRMCFWWVRPFLRHENWVLFPAKDMSYTACPAAMTSFISHCDMVPLLTWVCFVLGQKRIMNLQKALTDVNNTYTFISYSQTIHTHQRMNRDQCDNSPSPSLPYLPSPPRRKRRLSLDNWKDSYCCHPVSKKHCKKKSLFLRTAKGEGSEAWWKAFLGVKWAGLGSVKS